MGNTDSTMDSTLTRNNSEHDKSLRKYSNSPPGSRRNGSLSTSGSATQPLRRARTCRHKDRITSRRTVCAVTGLTIHQKALLTRKWNRMDKATIYEVGRRVFEGVFEESPSALAYIGLKDDDDWKRALAYRLHVQRFVCALTECMRRMRDPASACDVLRDFGAGYVQVGERKRVPATFFERLANALNEAARQLQESDHLSIERVRSHSTDDPSETSSEGGRDNLTSTTSTTTVLSDQFRPSICSGMTNNNNSAPCFLNPSTQHNNSGLERTPSTGSADRHSICPITSEAWLIFAVFVANQIKFGYELERVLQGEMSKLGLNNGPRKSLTDTNRCSEIALFNH